MPNETKNDERLLRLPSFQDYQTLFKNKWVEVRQRGYYVYAHEPWCNSLGVALLPFKDFPIQKNSVASYERKYLGRYEFNGAHIADGVELCSITGGYDNADKFTIEECALNELREEGGYAALPEDLDYLGTATNGKGTDKRILLFAVDLGKPHIVQVPATGDGSGGEVGAYCDWITRSQLFSSEDPLIQAMYARLMLR